MRALRVISLLVAGLATLLLAVSVAYKTFAWARVRAERTAWQRDVGSLDFADYATPRLSDGNNALPGLLEAGASVPRLGEEASAALVHFLDRPDLPLDAAAIAALRRAADSGAAAVARAAIAAAQPRASLGLRQPEDVFGLTERLGQLQLLEGFLGAEVALAAGEHDEPRALRALAIDARIVEALRAEPTLLPLIVSIGLEKRYFARTRAYLATAPNASAAGKLLPEIERIARAPGFARGLASEGALVATVSRQPDSRFAPRRGKDWLLGLLLPVSLHDQEAATLAALRETLGLADSPYVEWRQRFEDPELSRKPAARGSLYVIVEQALQTPARIQLREEQLLRDTRRLAIAAIRFYSRGNPTGDPEEAGSSTGDTPPRSALSGGPLRWRRNTDGRWQVSFDGAREALEPLRDSTYRRSLDRDLELLVWAPPAPPRTGP